MTQLHQPSSQPQKLAVILMNLGTPDAPTPKAVRKFLAEFLADQRVIEIPKFVWLIILYCFVLPKRPIAVAENYKKIWNVDSPMREILSKQAIDLQSLLTSFVEYQRHGVVTEHALEILVKPAMTYGSPSVESVVTELLAENVEHMVFLPLFPQYSATSSGASHDAIVKVMMGLRNIPSYTILKDYFSHPMYIDALAQSIQTYWQTNKQPEKLLFSFHGIPQPYADKGDPYPERCIVTAQLVAKQLGLTDSQWAYSFQSRFGKQEWVKPYTDVLLEEWAKQGVSSVHVISPAFSADCLETLEELAIENKETFEHTAKASFPNHTIDYHYIPALNTNEKHIHLLAQLSWALVQGFIKTLPHRVE